MGVNGLYKLINNKCHWVYEKIYIEDISNKTCIFDGMQQIYSELTYMRKNDKEILSNDGQNISHLHGLINFVKYYLKNGTIPLLIFDGKSPAIKKNKIEERRLTLQNNLNKLQNLNNMKLLNHSTNVLNYSTMSDINHKYAKINAKSIILKKYHIQDWIQLLDLLGLPVNRADGEADPLCSHVLKNNNNIFGIMSDDSDMLIFGAPILIKKSNNKCYTVIKLQKLLDEIAQLLRTEFNNDQIIFTHDNLIDYSILLGTDYGTFKLNYVISDTYVILKKFVLNNKDYRQMISNDQHELFILIKKYYTTNNLNITDKYDKLLTKQIWLKPNFVEFKKRLLELKVNENYIDINISIINSYYLKSLKNNSLPNTKSYNSMSKYF